MKLLFIVAILLLLIFTAFIMPNKNEDFYLSREEQLVNMILGKTAKIIKEKCNLQPVGSGSAMPGGHIRKLCLAFDTRDQHNKEELRKLLINCSEELLYQINIVEQIQPFLVNPPFTIKNVEIIVYNQDKNGRGLPNPEISTARISDGILIYKTVDPEDRFKYKNEFEETYHEALKQSNFMKNF